MNLHKLRLFAVLTILANLSMFSQVGIGTTTPVAGSSLHIEGSDKGVLINRVVLTGTDDTTTIASLGASQEGLMVYNTNTSSNVDPETDVTPGFYFWTGSEWKSSAELTKKTTGWVALDDGNYSLSLPGITSAQSTDPANFTDINLNFSDDASDSIIESYAPTGYGGTDFFDDATHRIMPIAEGDSVELRLRFSATPSANNSFLVIAIDIGSPPGIVIFQKTIPLLRSSGQINRINESILLYQTGSFVTNGAKLKIGYSSSSGSPGNVTLTNFNMLFTRLHSN